MIYFIVGVFVWISEPMRDVLLMPFRILKYMYCVIIFIPFRRRVRNLSVQRAHEYGVDKGMGWKLDQPKTIRELYRWLP